MFNFTDMPVQINYTKTLKAFKDPDDNSATLHCVRVQLRVDGLGAADVPFLKETVECALRETSHLSGEDGPNTHSIRTKQRFETCHYMITVKGDKRFLATIVGIPVSQPEIKIVEGVVGLEWTVEDQAMSSENLKSLNRVVRAEQMVLNSQVVQPSLPFDKNEETKAEVLASSKSKKGNAKTKSDNGKAKSPKKGKAKLVEPVVIPEGDAVASF